MRTSDFFYILILRCVVPTEVVLVQKVDRTRGGIGVTGSSSLSRDQQLVGHVPWLRRQNYGPASTDIEVVRLTTRLIFWSEVGEQIQPEVELQHSIAIVRTTGICIKKGV